LTCQSHICQHYSLYSKQYKKEKIPENHHAIPWALLKEKEKEKKQATLDGVRGTPKFQYSDSVTLQLM